MMNNKRTKLALLLVASAVSLTLSGCGGSDGDSGDSGDNSGAPAAAISELNFTFEDAAINAGIPTVNFSVTNEDDDPVIGLQKFRFSAAQLIPEGGTGAGNASEWHYFGNDNCTVDSDCAGVFVDNRDGSYTYTFGETLDELAEGKVTYSDQLAQRILIRAYDEPLADGTTIPNTNAFIDFDPISGGEPNYTRKLISNQSCNACHGDLGTVHHGGSYTDINYCSSCHGKGNGIHDEADELSRLIHELHKDVEGLDALDSCKSCHNDNLVEDTPDWGNWSRIPTAESCGSCHTDVDFAKGEGHSQQSDNSNCIACHNSTWTEEIHTGTIADKQAVIAQRGMTATLVANSDDTALLTVTLLDADGNAIDATSDIAKIKRLETNTNVGPNFPVAGYNASPGSGAAHVSKDLVLDGELQADVTIVDGKLQFTTPALPFDAATPVQSVANDTDTAFTFIGLEMCNEGTAITVCDVADTEQATTSMKSAITFGTKSGGEPSHRHINSVDYVACEGCHGDTAELHKGHHAGFVMTEQLGRNTTIDGEEAFVIGIDGCAVCHTPDGTYASGANKGALEMKLHVVHGGMSVIDGCTQCHNDLNLDAFKDKGALATSAGSYTTPITATCMSCHNGEITGNITDAHPDLGQYGAIVDGDYTEANDAAQLEQCLFCHAPTVADHTKVSL